MLDTLPPRLPGFRFEAPPMFQAEVLPRMDIAVFVGFAASGPLHTPVPIEDEAAFVDLFGQDAPLAWDAERSEPIYAYLGPAVRGFFRNGGRRCWVVRVASPNARANLFPIYGLAQAKLDDSGVTSLVPVCAPARSEGRWSDGLRVAAALESRPVDVVLFQPEVGTARLVLRSNDPLGTGDLLRFQVRAKGIVVLFPIDKVTSGESNSLVEPPAAGERTVMVASRSMLWLRAAWADPPTSFPKEVEVGVRHSSSDPVNYTGIITSPWPSQPDDPLNIDVHMRFEDAPSTGSLLELTIDSKRLWMTVERTEAGEVHGSPPEPTTRLSGPAWWQTNPDTALAAAGPSALAQPAGERLSFELWSRHDGQSPRRFRELGFAPGHPRYWGVLPTDAQLYRDASATERPKPHPFDRQVVSPRFPLAGPADQALFFPLNMPVSPQHFAGPLDLLKDAMERDGLETFGDHLFLDDRLRMVGVGALNAEADFIRYEADPPTPLKGIHAALAIEEATLIAVPDAVHRTWNQSSPETPSTLDPAPVKRPDWWHFLPCDPTPEIPPAREPNWGEFLNCSIAIIAEPQLTVDQPINSTGTFSLTAQSSVNGVHLILEEARQADFSDATERPLLNGAIAQVTGYPPGNYYYRARAVQNSNLSNWSKTVAVRVTPRGPWVAVKRDAYSAETLLAVQRATLRLCAARGDLLAVLSLPEHYLEDAALRHVEALSPPRPARGTVKPGPPNPGPALTGSRSRVPALTYGEQSALNNGAIYHPWLEGREGAIEFRRIPPDGPACGVLARRALKRGAWIAPANEPWRGVSGLTPTLAPERRLELQEARINVVRQEPSAFLTLCADTLSPSSDVRFIHVRRLLMLLRRLALKVGPAFAFEPNDASFRRLVQRNFEALLEDLFRRGAFAGKTPEASFQVATGNELNTPQNIERGRFLVELRVAPAQPLRFITLRLAQSGAGRLAVAEE